MTLYKGRYRIESTRRWNWDYTAPGSYFITICTAGKKPYFGTISNGTIEHSVIGAIAHQFWRELPQHYENVTIDEFVVMPNHVHGIVMTHGVMKAPAFLSREKKPLAAPAKGHVGAVVRSYKSAVSHWCSQQKLVFAWQRGFYDRLLFGNISINAVRDYIKSNPANWSQDGDYVELK
jgi:putative transposase